MLEQECSLQIKFSTVWFYYLGRIVNRDLIILLTVISWKNPSVAVSLSEF